MDGRETNDQAKVLKTALFLQRLGSHGPAIEHLSEVLTAEPYNVKALRALARSRKAIGDDERARALLERLHTIIPEDTAICVEIAESYEKAGDRASADGYIQNALAIDPDSSSALRAMVRVLVLTTVEGLSPALRRALSHHDIRILVFHIETLSIPHAVVPEHDLFFGLLAFDACYRSILLHLEEVISRTALPVVNRPAALLGSDPSILPWRLAPLEGLTVARTVRLDRELLESPNCIATLAEQRLQFPLLIRPCELQGARREHICSPEMLGPYLATTRARRFECTQFLDLRCADDRVRCYRMALVDQASYPLAFASAYHWRVDLNADDAWPQSLEEEERRFFTDPVASCGAHVLQQLRAVANCLEIDACAIDFSLNDDAALTVLAVDASCDWAAPPEEEGTGRRGANDRARRAVLALLLERTSSVPS
jgi:tetratricopeptide (TPR) repeat protein